MSTETPQKTSFWRKLARVILRVLLAIVLGFAIGVGIFAGASAYMRQSSDLQKQTELVQSLELRLEQFEEMMTGRAESLAERLDTVELNADKSKAQVAENTDRLGTVEAAHKTQAVEVADLDGRVSAMETTVGEIQADQVKSEELQSLNDQLDELRLTVDAILTAQDEISQTVETVQGRDVVGAPDIQALQVQVEMLKAVQLLLHSSNFVEQGNYAQAAVDIRAASDLLANLEGSLSPVGMEYLAELISELDEAQDDLPASPALAANRLEAAWQLLWLGLPEGSLLTPTPTPTPYPAP